jgi:hypothetical protein
MNSLKEVSAANNAAHDEYEFYEYAIHVATQLQKLPLVNMLRLQERNQKLITEERITCVTGAASSNYNRVVQEAVSTNKVSCILSARAAQCLLKCFTLFVQITRYS